MTSFNQTAATMHNDSSMIEKDIMAEIQEFVRPQVYKWIFLFVFAILFLVGTVGNFLVCYSVWRSHSLKNVTNYFLVNLAAADFFVILICLPASVSYDMLSSWFLGLVMCKLSVYLQRVSVFVSVLTLTSISVERYLAICYPLLYHGSYMKTRLIISIIWFVSLVTPTVDLVNMVLAHEEKVPESLRPWLTSCEPRDDQMEMRFNIFLLVCFYLLPLIVMSFTYIKIAACLWSSTSTLFNGASENLQHESAVEQLLVRRRTAKMLIVVVVTFGICLLPIHLLNILRYTTALDGLHQNAPAAICVYWTSRFLIYFNSAINPVIYNFMSVKFRKQFKTACFGCYMYFRCCCCCFKRSRRFRRSSQVPTMRSMYPSSTRTNNFRLTYVTHDSAVLDRKEPSS